MKDNLYSDPTILLDYDKYRWLARNRGVLSEVAMSLRPEKPYSKQFVRMVYWGQRRSQRVEAALRSLRAPGFERSRAA